MKNHFFLWNLPAKPSIHVLVVVVFEVLLHFCSSSDGRFSSHARTLTCFGSYPKEFGGKERLLAVYINYLLLSGERFSGFITPMRGNC